MESIAKHGYYGVSTHTTVYRQERVETGMTSARSLSFEFLSLLTVFLPLSLSHT
jgi:hypothetical protein